MMISEAWTQLHEEIVQHGGPEDAVNKFVNNGVRPHPYISVLIEYFDKLPFDSNEREMVIRCFMQPGMNDGVPFLLSLYERSVPSLWLDQMMYVGFALTAINDKSSYQDVIRILQERKPWYWAFPLFALLPRMKKSMNIVAPLLKEALRDPIIHNRISAVEAIAQCGLTEYLDDVRDVNVENPDIPTQNRELQRRKDKAISKLDKKLHATAG